MAKDPIVEAVRRVRERHAAKFNYDLDAICHDLKEQERKGGRRVVSLLRDALIKQQSHAR